MIALGVVLLSLYGLMLVLLVIGYRRLQVDSPIMVEHRKTRFSLIVPFRNEEQALEGLLSSVKALDYPRSHFELLLVDDFSEDSSKVVIRDLLAGSDINWRILQNVHRSKSPKKDAITLAVSQANHEWILTTDADCLLPKNWMLRMDDIISAQDPVMVCGPLTLAQEGGFLHQFQLLENLAVQVTTIGGFGWRAPFMCNGANLGFSRATFLEVDGYHGNDAIASGDDVFLLEKFSKVYPERILFLKNDQAVVTTMAARSWRKYYWQRVRWASKVGKMTNIWVKVVGLVVLLMNTWLVGGFLYTLFFDLSLVVQLLTIFTVKFTLDTLFALQARKVMDPGIQGLLLLPCSLAYPLVNVLLAVRSQYGGYRWKGRMHSS